MLILELFDSAPQGYHTEKDDKSVIKKSNTRKNRTRLSLAQINKLRTMNDVRKYEHEKKLTKISKQYKPPEAAAGAPGL